MASLPTIAALQYWNTGIPEYWNTEVPLAIVKNELRNVVQMLNLSLKLLKVGMIAKGFSDLNKKFLSL